MKTYAIKLLMPLMIGAVAISCEEKKEEKTAKEGLKTVLKSKINEVKVQPLVRTNFYYELVSNGKLKSAQFVNMHFKSPEVIEKIYVKNGTFVKKGDKIASLYKFKLEKDVQNTREAKSRCYLDVQNTLVSRGYILEDSLAIPKSEIDLAYIKNGYVSSVSAYELAVENLENATLRAPFSGVVANIEQTEHNMANTAEPFCALIAQESLELEFSILESELVVVKAGDPVVISPFADPTREVKGVVSEVNPVVNEEGMVKVKARLLESKDLFEGMNARVRIQRTIPNQLVVPKSALVIRSGKEVVFVLRDDKAYWVYVKKLKENSDSFVIESDDLQENETLITTGTINLAHKAPVKVIP